MDEKFGVIFKPDINVDDANIDYLVKTFKTFGFNQSKKVLQCKIDNKEFLLTDLTLDKANALSAQLAKDIYYVLPLFVVPKDKQLEVSKIMRNVVVNAAIVRKMNLEIVNHHKQQEDYTNNILELISDGEKIKQFISLEKEMRNEIKNLSDLSQDLMREAECASEKYGMPFIGYRTVRYIYIPHYFNENFTLSEREIILKSSIEDLSVYKEFFENNQSGWYSSSDKC